MPRRFLQRYMPHPETLRRQRSLRFMSHLIGNPALWVLSRRSVANAFSVGLFSAMLPIPFQMAVAALGAWLMNTPAREVPDRLSTRWIAEQMADILPALAVGSVVTALALALLGNLVIRLIWRWQVSRSWKARRRRRRRRLRDDDAL